MIGCRGKCWMHFIIMLLHYANAFSNFANGIDENYLDMDDLMKIHYRSPSGRRMYDSPFRDERINLDMLNKNFNNDEQMEKQKFSIPLNIDFNQLGLPGIQPDEIRENHEEKNKVGIVKDNDSISLLEELILHPTWVTRQDQQLKGENDNEFNRKDKPDIVKFRRLQNMLKEKFCKGNTCKFNNLWANLAESENHAENDNTVKIEHEKKANNFNHNFEKENRLVIRALNDFYKRLFNTLTEIVPSLMFEDPFVADYITKVTATNNRSTTDGHGLNIENIDIGNYIDRKLETLRKQSIPNGTFDVSLSKILDSFPNLLFMSYPQSKSKDEVNDKTISGLENSKSILGNKENINIPTNIQVLDNLFSYIPQISYNYDVVTGSVNTSLQNQTTTKPWYYSNYYKETTTTNNVTLSTVETETIPAGGIEWPNKKLKNSLNTKLSKYPNIDKFLHKNDINGRIEWEPQNYPKESKDFIRQQNILSTNALHNPTTVSIREIHFKGEPFWINDPVKRQMIEMLFNKNGGKNSNKQLLKSENNLPNSNYKESNSMNENGKYSVLENQQPIQTSFNHIFI